jgi:hypothetical protein
MFYNDMKKKLAVFAVAILSVCMLVRPSAQAIGISIDVGDRPYYEGPSYWDDGYEWAWIPGHWGEHHRWEHGHYERRGEWHREHAREHHHRHDRDRDRDHDRY